VIHGIDVKAGALVVKRAGGVELSGAAAVRAIRADPVLSAAFALSAADPAGQNAQLEVAKTHKMDRDGLDRSVTIVVANKPYTFKARDVFTSEWGAAVVANGGVHAGPGHVEKSLKSGLTEFFAKNPKLDPAKPATWAGLAETFIAPRLIAGDSYRAKAFEKDGLSKAAGSYDGSIPEPVAAKK
jgi:hypothetical protein